MSENASDVTNIILFISFIPLDDKNLRLLSTTSINRMDYRRMLNITNHLSFYYFL